MKEFIADFIWALLFNLDANISEASAYLRADFINGGGMGGYDFGGFHSFILEVIGVVKPIALIIVSICFLMEFIKITMKFEVLKWETFFKVFFKLVLAKVVIDISFDFLLLIYQTSCEWILDLTNHHEQIGHIAWNKISSQVNNYSTMEMIGVVCTVGILIIGIKICLLLAKIMSMARMIEMVIYIGLSPIPMAFVPLEDGQLSRIPKTYIINFASMCLTGVIMMIAFRIYTIMGVALIGASNGIVDVISSMLVATVILVLTISKSGSIAKSILSA